MWDRRNCSRASSGANVGLTDGGYRWVDGLSRGVDNGTGSIMIAVLPTIIGVQLLLSVSNYDIANRFTRPIHEFIGDNIRRGSG